ncbi:MAG TPA: hypothetical protein VK964_06680 [Nocardioidaceae bacterium]|nr:hypothetical protein [Nocardioidaceae bacterium]
MTAAHPHTSVDVAVGATARVVALTGGVLRAARSGIGPAVHVALHPPIVPRRLHPARWVERLGEEGSRRRAALLRELSHRFDVLVPVALAEILRRARLAELLPRYVDLDAVVAAVDLDKAASRLDVDAVIRRADVEAVLARVDVDAVANRLDLDAVLDRLDLDAVLDRLDLTAVVLERVDLDRLVDSVLAGLDLAGLAEQVVDDIDLPEIIRESTGSMASDTVRGVRMQGIAADEAVDRAVARLRLRRRRPPQEPAIPPQDGRNRFE